MSYFTPPSTHLARHWGQVTRAVVIALSAWGLQAGCDADDDPEQPGETLCVHGTTETRVCADGGTQVRNCEDGTWGEFSACPTINCTDILIDIPCGLNDRGVRNEVCEGGVIVDPGTCVDPDECKDGDTDAQACGYNENGTYTSLCVEGQWTAPSEGCVDTDVCANDTQRTTECGTNGIVGQTCVSGQWKDDESCVEGCVNDDTQSVSCGINGNGSRELLCVEGEWQESQACADPDVCENNATDTETCGHNDRGEQALLCANGQWQPAGACVDNDVCTDDENSTEACGLNNSGTQALTCVEGQWVAAGGCVDNDLCTNGATNSETCGLNDRGEQALLCVEGAWQANGACIDPDVCTDGTNRDEACGLNDRGVEVLVCTDGQWTEQVACMDPDTCTDNATDTGTCGLNDRGEQPFLCVDGNWIDNGPCTDPDVCTDGTEQRADCPNSGGFSYLHQTCFEGQWEGEDCVGTSIDVNTSNVCVVHSSGHVLCWGDNNAGQLGIDDLEPHSDPTYVYGNINAIQVAVGGQFVCALTANGDVYCWGDGSDGALGNGPQTQALTPTKVQGLGDIQSIAAGTSHVCALRINGDVLCWGQGGIGQLGHGGSKSYDVPVLVDMPTGVSFGSIYANYHTTCARVASADPVESTDTYCWGSNFAHGAGVYPVVEMVPLLRPTLIVQKQFLDVALVHARFCGLDYSEPTKESPNYLQTLHCIGAAGPQLCDNDGTNTYASFNIAELTSDKPEPLQIKGGGIGDISNMCALNTRGGALSCWGYNQDYSLGREFDREGTVGTAAISRPASLHQNIDRDGQPFSQEIRGILDFAVDGYAICIINRNGAPECTGIFSPNTDGTMGAIPNLPPLP